MLVSTINIYRHLWKTFVAQLDGWRSPWDEMYVTESVPPEHVRELIAQGSPRWPSILVVT